MQIGKWHATPVWLKCLSLGYLLLSACSAPSHRKLRDSRCGMGGRCDSLFLPVQHRVANWLRPGFTLCRSFQVSLDIVGPDLTSDSVAPLAQLADGGTGKTCKGLGRKRQQTAKPPCGTAGECCSVFASTLTFAEFQTASKDQMLKLQTTCY